MHEALGQISELTQKWTAMVEVSYQRPRHRFHRVGDITVTGDLAFTDPAPDEWHSHDAVPPSRYPVYMGIVEEPEPGGPQEFPPSWTSLTVVPLAAPEVIAEAVAAERYEEVYQDYQALGPDIGVLWDEAAGPLLGEPGTVDRIEEALREGDAARRVPNVIALDPGLIAFRVWGAADADGMELYAPDGRVVCLIFTTSE